MPQMKVSPTRSNLIRTKQALAFAQEGYEILDKKREVLTSELVHMAHDAERLERQVWDLLEAAYRALEQAKLTMGEEHLEWAALAVNKTVEVEVRSRGIMGVPIPSVSAHGTPPEMPYSLGDTAVTLDKASAAFREVLNVIPEMSELMTAVWRLARELRKTQRRVNALQYIFIPEYEDTVVYIESALEEREREEIFRLKLLKSRAAGPPEEHAPRSYEQPYRDVVSKGAGLGGQPYRDVVSRGAGLGREPD